MSHIHEEDQKEIIKKIQLQEKQKHLKVQDIGRITIWLTVFNVAFKLKQYFLAQKKCKGKWMGTKNAGKWQRKHALTSGKRSMVPPKKGGKNNMWEV